MNMNTISPETVERFTEEVSTTESSNVLRLFKEELKREPFLSDGNLKLALRRAKAQSPKDLALERKLVKRAAVCCNSD